MDLAWKECYHCLGTARLSLSLPVLAYPDAELTVFCFVIQIGWTISVHLQSASEGLGCASL